MAKELTFKINSSMLVVFTAGLLLGLLVGFWSPWTENGPVKTVSLEGSATIEVEPDEFVYYPTIQVEGSTQQAAKEVAQNKGQQLANSITELGLDDSQLDSSLDVYQSYNRNGQTGTWSGYYRLTITAKSQEQSESVYQVLLKNSDVSSGVDPYSQLSEEKRKEVENEARSQAIADARVKAEQSAANLGKKLGDVVTVEDQSGFGVFPYATIDTLEANASTEEAPRYYSGTQDVTFTVKAVFEIK